MKLTIGESIRRLRRKADMTQEQLADQLGVSYQSVSRWENGATYPDLELIPVLAGLFSVTTDELLEISTAEREAQATQAMRELRLECSKTDYRAERITELLRDIRLNYLDHRPNSDLWHIGNARAFRDPRILPEARAVFERFVKLDLPRLGAIDVMSRAEEDERLDELFGKYSVAEDYYTESSLRLRRYLELGDYDRYESTRRWKFYSAVCALLGDSHYYAPGCADSETTDAADCFRERLLELLCDGSTEVCLFTSDFIELGFKRAARLVREGKHDEAIGELCGCAELLEAVMKITEPIDLATGSRWIDGLTVTAREDFGELGYRRERGILINAMYQSYGFAHMIYPSEFSARLDGEGLEVLRGKQLDAIRARISALIVRS